MYRPLVLLGLMAVSLPALAQTSGVSKPPPRPQASSPYYPAPPPERAPQIQEGAPITDLTSPLDGGRTAVARTAIDSESEARLFAGATRLVWGRYARIKGAKPGAVAVDRQGPLWTVKGRLDSVAPGTEGDWASIDGVVERIAANTLQVRGEVAFRVAKVQNGTPCKVAGTLHFKRAGKSQVWRLVEGDNPCDGTREMLDLAYDKPARKPAEKKTAAAQPKRD